MNLNVVKTEIQKCFKCGKPKYIQRFYRNRAMKVINVLDLKNESLLTLKESQKKEL